MEDQEVTNRELVYCHQCRDEWYRDEHGLECPECHSQIVEIIEPNSDPRQQDTFPDIGYAFEVEEPDDEDGGDGNNNEDDHHNPDHSRLREDNPFHDHNPWQTADAPDPDEGDIDHVEWNGPIRISHSHTMQHTFHAGATDPFSQLFTSFLGPQMQRRAQQENDQQPDSGPRSQTFFAGGSQGNSQPQPQGPFRFGPGPGIRGGITITTRGFGPETTTQQFRSDDLAGIFGTLLGSLHGAAGPGGANQLPHPFGLLSPLFNPANARSGDAVFTQEALDRVISQLMEQHSAGNAPGPASEAAIAALPKLKISIEHFAENGKAECSICLNELELGTEVTELPCKHWFHDECVGAWLREHDTCPQCRRGITPKDGDPNSPRATGETPRFWQMSESELLREVSGSNSQNTEAAASSPGQVSGVTDGPGSTAGRTPENEAAASSTSFQTDRRSESSRGSLASGIAGLMGRFRRSSNDGGNNGH